ncbi:hypothetical protein PTSG_10681 [Salpingoeca rosetta]|uniref:Uncharacterized protein n=1 Tax=Salpingoeca rosetta (strain ATCC 50818 / BSB-021) TaxID=946362 RepID=F2UQ28_SALR5|nr:uncharacterized protein PTSG_10681 [Salpingoeca rosetta]EGD79696.1 hypothetical protein PTSG_10681 [Salpingoeca rosetta]|eukprot:XP_004988646.1 hypothetical protein PTSG_10681 [Salpingoeca rosetta]
MSAVAAAVLSGRLRTPIITTNNHQPQSSTFKHQHISRLLVMDRESAHELGPDPEEPVLSVHEWALIAQHVLTLEAVGSQGDSTAPDHVRACLRACFNLMLTCRHLYHALPFMMPKWCLAEPLRRLKWRIFESNAMHWLDAAVDVGCHSDQDRGACAHTPATDARTAESATTRRTATSTTATTDMSAGGCCWLEERFLAHAWLGWTWSCDCPFLKAKARSPAFCARFAVCGRVRFDALVHMAEWINCNVRDSAIQQGGDDADGGERSYGDSVGARDDFAVPDTNDASDASTATPEATGRNNTTQEEEKEEIEAAKQEGEGKEEVDEAPSASSTRQAPSTGSTAPPPKQRQLFPALITLKANIKDQATLDAFARLRSELNNVAIDQLRLFVTSSLEEVDIANARFVFLLCEHASAPVVVARASFRNVARVAWYPDRAQRSITGLFSGVGAVELHGAFEGSFGVSDVSALAGVPDVQLTRLPSLHDVSPLCGADKVHLHAVGVRDMSPLENVAHVTISSCNQLQIPERGLKLGAATVHVLNLPSLRGALLCPRADDVSVVSCPRVSLIRCSARPRRLCICACPSLECIPSFEHVDELTLDAPADRDLVASLRCRVDNLTISTHRGGAVATLRHVAALPATSVHLSDCIDMDVMQAIPPCVKHMSVRLPRPLALESLRGLRTLDITCDQEVVLSSSHVEGLRRVHTLTMRGAHLNGVAFHCFKHLKLGNCSGSLSVSNVDTFLCEHQQQHAPLSVLSMARVGQAQFRAMSTPPIDVGETHHVHLLSIVRAVVATDRCAGFAGAHRLHLRNCKFRSADGGGDGDGGSHAARAGDDGAHVVCGDVSFLPPVPILSIKGCQLWDGTIWPSITRIR